MNPNPKYIKVALLVFNQESNFYEGKCTKKSSKKKLNYFYGPGNDILPNLFISSLANINAENFHLLLRKTKDGDFIEFYRACEGNTYCVVQSENKDVLILKRKNEKHKKQS